ncbi:MAG: zinc-ribbon and DUF3426 domain-containing protein [Pseudomonadota bacterium]
MDGTTRCPHCDTHLKIAQAQMLAFHGMVRCGGCLQPFDARYSFIPDEPDPQLALPIPDDADDVVAAAASGADTDSVGTAVETPPGQPQEMAVSPDEDTAGQREAATAVTGQPASAVVEVREIETPAELPEDSVPPPPVRYSEELIYPDRTLAERVAIIHDEDSGGMIADAPRVWPWVIANLLLLLLLLAQIAYFFRAHLVDYQPELRPALLSYCGLLECDVPLPRNIKLMSIESSDLEASLDRDNEITLHVLLRNRATFTQAFPDLELTLNDVQEQAVARRLFVPQDYLPPLENVATGLLPNHEIEIKLRLDIADLKPNGYRLVLSYAP